MPSRKPPKSKGSDGLTDREREFARLRRDDPAAPAWEIAERAGFQGTKGRLGERARLLMKKQAISRMVFAPRPREVIDPDKTKEEVQFFFRDTMRDGRSQTGDRIKAADKLMATIPGGYVPVQIDHSGKLTLETLVSAMGRAPQDHAALPPAEEKEEENT